MASLSSSPAGVGAGEGVGEGGVGVGLMREGEIGIGNNIVHSITTPYITYKRDVDMTLKIFVPR